MLFGLELTEVIRTIGVIGIMAIIFAESGLLVGFFLPGDTLLLTAGFLVSQNVLGVSMPMLVGLLFVSAIAGDSVGYTFGRRIGRRIFKKKDSILFHQDNLQRAERFHEKYGAITIVLARFVPLVRTFAPIVAGVGKMKYKTFLTFNIIGGLIWTAGIAYLGFFAGAWFEANGIDVDHLILPVIGFAVLVTTVSPLVHIIKDPDTRKMTIDKIKSIFRKKHKD